MGSLFSQIPGGILVQKFGGKWIYSSCIFLSAITTALIPLAVDYGIDKNKEKLSIGLLNRFFFNITGEARGLIAALALAGFLHGPLIPAVSSFTSRWFVTEERGRIVSFIFMGLNVRNGFKSPEQGINTNRSF